MTEKLYASLMRILIENGGLDRVRRFQLHPHYSAKGIADYAGQILTKAMECLIAGMEAEALELLPKADEWLTRALNYAAAGDRITLEYDTHFELSLCRWLMGPPACSYDLTRGCELLHQSQCMANADLGRNADTLDNVLTMLVYAGRYEDCIAKFEQEQAKAPRSRKQKHAQAMRDFWAGKLSADEAAFLHLEVVESPLAYRIAQERLKSRRANSRLKQRCEAMFKQRVPVWLNSARYCRYGMWVQIVTQAEAGAAARSAIREIADLRG